MSERTERSGLVKLSESDRTLKDPSQDLRGKDVYDRNGDQIGTVEDHYMDRQTKEVRFLVAEPRDLLGLLYGVMEEAQRYEDCPRVAERFGDQELADFFRELRDESRGRADRAGTLLAQRLANGGVR